MDKRQAPRFKVRLPIAFLGYNLTGEGIVVNLSLGGCWIESDQNVQQGKELSLRILMPDQDAPLVVNRAEVRWTVRGLFGLEFLAMPQEEGARLRRVVSTLKSGPSPLSKSKSKGPTERRRAARFPVRFTLDFLGPHAAGDGTVSDLSMGGCQVDTKTSVYIGMYLPVRLYLPGQEATLKVDQAAVRWAKKEKYGLEFMSMWPEEEERLHHLVSTLERVRVTDRFLQGLRAPT